MLRARRGDTFSRFDGNLAGVTGGPGEVAQSRVCHSMSEVLGAARELLKPGGAVLMAVDLKLEPSELQALEAPYRPHAVRGM